MTCDERRIREVAVGDERRRCVDLKAFFGDDLRHAPYVLRLLAENHIRNGGETAGLLDTLLGPPNSGIELLFQPNRLLMHDTTATPALADAAGLRDVVAEAGGDPRRLSPAIPVHVSVDHSLAVNAFARPDAAEINLLNEIRRNHERYAFLKWAASAFGNLTVLPPGAGIMHTINLEQLSTLLCIDRHGIAHPDMMLGTDSHTPMVNGIGVLAWGVGGLEAEAVMFGEPVALARPKVTGVRVTGRLGAGAFSTDIALTATALLRQVDVSGCFVEFFGPGVCGLSAGDRAVIANMAPEYGATTAYFPVDAAAVRYLDAMGRPRSEMAAAEAVFRSQGLWFEPDATPRYDQIIDLDLSQIGPTVAGPTRPQDKRRTSHVRRAVEEAVGRELSPSPAPSIPDGAIGIAAITSCTNTSDPRLLVAAGLLARAARRRGLKPPPWVKTSMAPGSPSTRAMLDRAGLLADLSWAGFDIVGFGCTTCIGNSGALPEAVEQALDEGKAIAAVLSGNRNFPGRVHPRLSLGFLASPPMVVAYAIRGDLLGDIACSPLGVDESGSPVFLRDLWPQADDVDAVVRFAFQSEDVSAAFQDATRNQAWAAIPFRTACRFPWDENSRILRRPVFVRSATDHVRLPLRAKPLLVLGDDITTDHISPAGAVDPASAAGRWLIERGADPTELNVYASYRGNWEVMLRGLFTNQSVVNLLAPALGPGVTLCPVSGRPALLTAAAEAYRRRNHATVIIAGERYGAGSSRDWAAKGVALLGVRAVIAKSFERIHRTNLVSMGILPIAIAPSSSVDWSRLDPLSEISVEGRDNDLGPWAEVRVSARVGGERVRVDGVLHATTRAEVRALKTAGVLPQIVSRALS